DAANSKLKFDFIVITMKNLLDVYSIPELVEPLVTPASTIVLIQNGIEIEKPFTEKYPDTPLISCVAKVATSEVESGIIEHKNATYLSIGIYPKANSQKYAHSVTTFSGTLERGGIDYDIVEDIESLRWFKLMWIGSISPLCILANGCDTYDLLNDEDATQLVRDAMLEIKLLGEKILGTKLTFGPFSTIEDYIAATKNVHFKPSLLLDFERKKLLELETTLGAIVRFARRLNHPLQFQTPSLQSLNLPTKRTGASSLLPVMLEQ
ncbi:hypothetical protein L0F63_005941, partial [Massospora cicadina]